MRRPASIFRAGASLLLLAGIGLLAAADATAGVNPQRRAVSIETPDGIALAADVIRSSTGGRLPAVLVITPYGRATRMSTQAIHAFLANKIAVVLVDERGSGASQGHTLNVFSNKERSDIVTVVRWIAHQPWSNGQVIPTGTSYDGNLAALAVVLGGKAVVAAIPRFIDFDTYRDLALPGGVRNQMLLRAWGALTEKLNQGLPCLLQAAACADIPSLEPLDGDTSYRRLRAALLDHQKDWNAYADTRGYAFENDVTPAGRLLRAGFLSSEKATLRVSHVPVQIWGSWFDAATADSALHWYRLARSTPMEVYLGAWTHGGGMRVDPFTSDRQEDEASAPSVGRAILEFIRRATREPETVTRVIHYYTAGAEVWRTTRNWPPVNIFPHRWYLDDHHTLSTAGPSEGSDRYRVDFSASTGNTNRWTTQLGGGLVDYGNRAAADRKLLTYTSAPLGKDIEITGTPAATLSLSTSAPDGAIFVYLEAVEPDGRVVYLTEGELRLALRGGGGATNRPAGMAPSFLRADVSYLRPDRRIEIGVRLHAVSVKLTKGMRLRVAIAGADAGTFARYPAEGDPVLTIRHSSKAPSFVEVPEAPWTAPAATERR